MKIKDLQMKRVWRVALLLLLSTMGMKSGFAQSFTVGDLNYSVNSDGVSVTLTGHVDGEEATGELEIPESVTYEETVYPVTVIGDWAFHNCTNLTGSLNIPNSVTTIGKGAFDSCSGFTGSLVIGNSVTMIGYYAFESCSGFTGDLVIGNSVINIKPWAFKSCSGFTGSLTIGNSVTEIGSEAFSGCSGLEQIIVASENPVYDSRENCNAIIMTSTNELMIGFKNTVIPNSVTTIGYRAFFGCSSFTGGLTIPNSVTAIGGDAFYNTAWYYNQSNGILYLDGWCIGYKGGQPTGTIVLEDNTRGIADYAFSGYSGFTGGLTIPNSVTKIGNHAFWGCSGLTGSLTIGNSVTTIGHAAFRDCSGFTGSLIIPNSVTTISDYVFSGCSGFTGSLTIPSSVTTIGERAFYNCSGFTGSLTIPNSVTTIGSGAFCACSGFTGSLTIPNSVTTIGGSAFMNCSGLIGGLTIPNSVTTIGNSAFYNCSGFTGSLTIPNSVTSIGSSAFYGCSGFTGSLTIPNSVTTIDRFTFSGCSGLTGTLTIPNSVTTIGDDAFYYCRGLTCITSLAETPPTLGSYVFGWSSIIQVFVPCGSEETYIAASWGGFTHFEGLCGGMVTVIADPEEGGTVTGTGVYEAGQMCTVTATANEGYVFANWTYNGSIVSNEATYSFYVADGMIWVAHFVFVPEGIVEFADANVKAICVANWDTNGDGELSYGEAAVVTDIGQVFRDNTAITSFEELQYFTSLTAIRNYAFHNCSGLTGSLTIPNSVITIGHDAFHNCSGLTGSLTIPNSVTTIGYYAFRNCSGFTGSLTIPNSVTTIGDAAFYYCRGFICITSFAETPPTLGSDVFSVSSSVPVFVPCGSEETYAAASWGGFSHFESLCGGTVIVAADPEEGGTVTGTGVYEAGQMCTVTATANEGYVFVKWIQKGETVSTEAEYTFYVTKDVNMVAHFVFVPEGVEGIIEFADANVKAICVANWDTNGDGELSYGEAAAVTDLGQVFRNNTVITSFVELQYFRGLTAIGNGAFYNCSGLTGSLTIPNSVITIGDGAFRNCSGFTGSLTIPNSVTTIGESAFIYCSGFTGNLVIGNSVTAIGNSAFYGCSGFTGSLTIPNSVTTIGYDAFSYCSRFTGSLTIPNSVTTIGYRAFYCCSGFTGDLTIPNSVITIGDDAFHNCSGFTGNLVIGNSVTTIDQAAFNGCRGFTCINSLAETPPTLGSYVFSLSSSIPVFVPCGSEETYTAASWGGFTHFEGLCGGTVTVTADPEEGGTVTGTGVYEVGQMCMVTATANEGYVFANWTYNGSIVSNDATYSSYVADGMILVAHFVLEGNIEFADANVKAICVANWDTDGDGELSYGEAAAVTDIGQVFRNNTTITSFEELQYFIGLTTIDSYAFSNCTNLTGSLNIPNSVTVIGYRAFDGCSGFTGSLTIPNSVTTISERAFFNCSGFTGSLTIPNSVTTIGEYAFNNCIGFTGSLTIPNSVTMIGNGAFYGCSGFTGSLTIPNSVTTIGYCAFYYCSGFTGSLTIPNSVTTIGERAFYNCSGFTGSLTIPNSVTTIGNYAFIGCNGFTGGLTIGNSVTTIGNEAFFDCYGFTGSLTIPNSVIAIGNSAFYDCRGFTGNLVIGNSVTTIGEDVFYGCRSFTGSLTIPNSVTAIGDRAFYGCRGFTGSLTIPNSVISIGNAAFRNCSGFTGNLTIPNSVTRINSRAFYGCSGLSEVLMLATTQPTLGANAFNNTDFPIYVPYESLNAYKTATSWSSYESRIFPMAYTSIPGYGEGEGNYRFIASPLVENTAPTTVDNMITETDYDLYQFNQLAAGEEWQNYKANTEDFVLANGQGYLYANAEEVNLVFKGEFNEEEFKEVNLVYDANAHYSGWNLVGNPFPVAAYANRSYYTLNTEGTAIEPNMASSATLIPACTGIMVKAEGENETVTFGKTAPSEQSNQGNLQILVARANTRGLAAEDKAIVSFNEDDRLEKFVFNKDNASLCIPQGGKEYAIACVGRDVAHDVSAELPLNFKATKNGEYTLSVSMENVELGYLHLIDNLTGTDIDLLSTLDVIAGEDPQSHVHTYTFRAKTTDYACRFRLVFNANETGSPSTSSGTFAFFNNGGNLTIFGIEGEATLQVVDVLGHVLSSEQFNGSYEKKLNVAPGVYMFRLINGNDVKVQKIVVK